VAIPYISVKASIIGDHPRRWSDRTKPQAWTTRARVQALPPSGQANSHINQSDLLIAQTTVGDSLSFVRFLAKLLFFTLKEPHQSRRHQTIFRCHRQSQIIEYSVIPSCLSDKLISRYAMLILSATLGLLTKATARNLTWSPPGLC